MKNKRSCVGAELRNLAEVKLSGSYAWLPRAFEALAGCRSLSSVSVIGSTADMAPCLESKFLSRLGAPFLTYHSFSFSLFKPSCSKMCSALATKPGHLNSESQLYDLLFPLLIGLVCMSAWKFWSCNTTAS